MREIMGNPAQVGSLRYNSRIPYQGIVAGNNDSLLILKPAIQ